MENTTKIVLDWDLTEAEANFLNCNLTEEEIDAFISQSTEKTARHQRRMRKLSSRKAY